MTGFQELVAALGSSPYALLESAGLEPSALQDPDTYLSYPAVARLLELSARRCKRPDLGVLLAERQGLEITGALASLLCLQTTLGRALEMIQSHLDFHARGLNCDLDTREGQLVVTMTIAFAHQTQCSQVTALSLGVLQQSLGQLCNSRLAPEQVELQQVAPGSRRQFEKLFGAPVLFAQPYDRIRYPLSILSRPIEIRADLRERLSQLWRQTDAERMPVNLPQQVERAITSLLPTGDCSLANVARMLELHPRVLQERLRKEQLTFGEILRSSREKLAREHLGRTNVSMTRLAMQLGYGDLSIFSRNFKKWTGTSPMRWRGQTQTQAHLANEH